MFLTGGTYAVASGYTPRSLYNSFSLSTHLLEAFPKFKRELVGSNVDRPAKDSGRVDVAV